MSKFMVGLVSNMKTLSTTPKKALSPSSHALLSASLSSRWLHCTPAPRLEEKFGIKSDSTYAQEGTLAHAFCALYLEHDILHKIGDKQFSDELERLMSNELFTEEMLDYVDQYVEYCTNEYMEALAHEKQASMFVEQKLDLREFIPEGFGTADCCVISDDVLEVIDFKYGMGVPVYADWNSQLMLYGLGALQIFSGIYDIKEVLLTIVQPRIDNISSFQISVDELNKWVIDELKPKARMAWNGEGELTPGDWCKFCTVKTRCRALYEEQIKIAKADFAEDPRMLSDEDIADIVKRAPGFTSWVNAVTEYAQSQAVNEGKQWPGLKLVEGRSVRKWIDPDLAEKTIRERCPEIPNEVLYTTKLSSLTTIEKAVGKKEFSTLFADIVVKPAGTPTLVPEDDKRPAIGIAQAQKDFQ